MHRFIAIAFAAAMLAAGAAPALAGDGKQTAAPQSVTPTSSSGGGGCYEEYSAVSKPTS